MKNMKHFIYFSCLTVCIFFFGCEKFHYGYQSIRIQNNANYDIYSYSIINKPICATCESNVLYPDTSLPDMASAQMIHIDSHQSADLNGRTHRLSDLYNKFNTDTVSIFIFHADTIENTMYWGQIRDSYNILQRYDVSVDDALEQISLSFPPTEEMRNIKMWPPYGTYNTDGFRIE